MRKWSGTFVSTSIKPFYLYWYKVTTSTFEINSSNMLFKNIIYTMRPKKGKVHAKNSLDLLVDTKMILNNNNNGNCKITDLTL